MGRFERDGYAIADLVIASSACERIAAELPAVDAQRGGVRGLIDSRTVARIVQSRQFSRAIHEYADAPLVAVKAMLFDKTPAGNWRVQWHQDRAIAVREQRDVEGFGPWSVKDGIPHVEPPAYVLESMVAVRIHLDDCGSENGPLRVIPGSHRLGKLDAAAIARVIESSPLVELALPRGAILLMRPLLLHASSPATTAAHRRVLHIELAPADAIPPLQWHHAVAVPPPFA
jgi:ectoine hydroxylase-related dioxygenase (phytanoyl-CoA dioxygenase family)